MSPSLSLPELLSRYPLTTYLSSLFLALLIYVIYTRYSTPLRKVPGPWLGSISQLDRLLTAASGKQMLTHIRYHERYGPVVRVGPNHVSFADGALIPKVYGIAGKFRKVSSRLLLSTRIRWQNCDLAFSGFVLTCFVPNAMQGVGITMEGTAAE